MLSILLTFVYVVVCIFLILVVLLQTGKRADLAGAFGGGGSQTAFGARGAATLLTKATTLSAILFMILALTLSILSSRREAATSVFEDLDSAGTSAPAPAVPEAPVPLAPAPESEVPPPAPPPDSQP